MATIRFVQFLLIKVSILVTLVSSQECKHPLLIMMATASGVDITKLDFLPIGGASSSSRYEGFVENVFNFTCNDGKFHDVGDNSNHTTEYDIPDTLKGSIGLLMPWDNRVSYSIALNPLDAKRSRPELLDQSHLLFTTSLKKTFSQNRKHQSLLKQYFDSGKLFVQVSKEDQSTKFELSWRNASLSNDFEEFITQKLPSKYEDNPALYQQFVQRFGTHFFHYGRFGLIHTLQIAIDQQYAIDHSDEQILCNVKVAFQREFNIGLRMDIYGHYVLNETCQVDDDFAKNSEIILSYGGNVSKWADKVSGKTILDDNNSGRVLLSAELHNLGDLIANETIKAQVQIAIGMYTIEAYLGELKNVYDYTNYQRSNEENALFVAVETMLKSNDIQNMDKMEENIDFLYHKVPMFTDKKFCYQTLYDLYVTANLKLTFAKQICANSIFKGNFARRCASGKIVSAQKEVNEFFSSYENGEQGLDCVKNVRKLNLEYGTLKARDNGLETTCIQC